MTLLDRIGDWNPQLFREIKGRLKIFPMLIAAAISVVGQLILLLINLGDIPGKDYPYYAKYCTIRATYEQQLIQLQQRYHELQNQFYQATNGTTIEASFIQKIKLEIETTKVKIDNLSSRSSSQNYCPLDAIDMQAWWHDHYGYLFQAMSIIFVFGLLVAGTYLLTNDLVKEERRGTLNFLRLTPQSALSIMLGKMLGVPILIYLITALAIPLHLWAGIHANISGGNILGFWVILVASCALFYTTAVFVSLFNSLYSGFLPWIGSSLVLLLLIITLQLSSFSNEYNQYASAWMMLLSPFNATARLFPEFHNLGGTDLLQWYYLNIGSNNFTFVTFALFNYALCTYWMWQGVKRCFHNPNGTILSKRQSYCLVLCFEVMTIGFALQEVEDSMAMIPNLILLFLYNTVLLFTAIAILSPSRQAVQDWARYRYPVTPGLRRTLLQDLLTNDKSPAILAMAVNLAIATIPISIWVLLPIHHYYDLKSFSLIKAGVSLILFIGLMLIYATIAQIMLMLKNNQRVVWAVGTVSAAIAFPPIVLIILGINPESNSTLWLWSSFPWAAVEFASVPSMIIAFLGQLSILGSLNFHLTRQVRLAGESATIALVGSRSRVV